MRELITRQQADLLFLALLVAGLVAGPVAALIAKARRGDAVLAAVAVGAPPVLLGTLWRVYNAVTDRLGLDTVKNLLVNAALFVAVGILCGVLWAWLTARRAPHGRRAEGMRTMTWQVWQNPEVAARFTDRRRGGLLGGDVQLETMLRLLRVVDVPTPTVLDLGCGDGALLRTVMEAYPEARTVALDGSTAMLERAREQLAARGVYITRADFNDPEWTEMLPVKRFDAVVSGFAIHHSEDARKRELYAEIYDLLAPGGVFVNIEHVASATPLGERLFEEAYAQNVWRFRREQGEDVTLSVVLEELRTRPDKAANRLAPVETQLDWLRGIGYVDVDCYWKHFELAVLAGFRSQSDAGCV